MKVEADGYNHSRGCSWGVERPVTVPAFRARTRIDAVTRTLPAAIVLLLGVGPVLADDTFSRAVYCTAVIRDRVESARRTISDLGIDRSLNPNQRQQAMRTAQQLDQQYTGDFNRFRTYVVTNTRSGDIEQYAAFMVALKRGELDITQCQKERKQTGTCLRSCVSNCRLGDFSCVQGCDRQCGASTCARTDACSDTSFLPY